MGWLARIGAGVSPNQDQDRDPLERPDDPPGRTEPRGPLRGPIAPVVGLAAGLLVVLPGLFLFLGMGAAILAITIGLVAYRQRSAPGPTRLAGAAGMALGVVALLVAALRYAAALAAVREIEKLF